MGRRLRGAALRASKRIKLADQEQVDAQAKHVETQDVSNKADDDLFVLDTQAVLPSKKQLAKKEQKKVKNNPRSNPSSKEKAQIEKLIQRHSAVQLQKLAAKSKTMTARSATRKGKVRPNFDLWEEGSEATPSATSSAVVKTTTTSSSRSAHSDIQPVIGSVLAGTKPTQHVTTGTWAAKPSTSQSKDVHVDVAKSGQSYNPDKFLHQKVLQEAVKVEQKRQHAEQQAKAPISTGMSAETRALLLGSDSEDDSSSDEDNDGDAVDAANNENANDSISMKIQKKMTRAERNKQKRIRAEQHEIQQRKKQKKLQNAVGEAKLISKQLKKQEKAILQKRQEIELLKAANSRIKGSAVYERLAEDNPINAPTYPVALSSELKQTGGSLRTIRPKGSLLTDRMVSLADRDMTAKKQIKKRKRVEGKRRKMKLRVRGKGHAESREGEILG